MNYQSISKKQINDMLTIEIGLTPRCEKCRIISVSGRLDTHNSVIFTTELEKIGEEYNIMIFDLKTLDYVSSTGIGCFVHMFKLLKSRQGEVILININDKVRTALDLLGFLKLFPIKHDLAEAVDFVDTLTADDPRTFPAVVSCPRCQKKYKVSKSNWYRCSDCKEIFFVDLSGKIKSSQVK